MSRYPSLLAPVKYTQEADDLLNQLHGIEYFPLSFGHALGVADHEIDLCEQRIKQATSPRHKELLEPKLRKWVCRT